MVDAYFDCFSGVAGDMILGSLFAVGLDERYFKNEIKKLGMSDYTIKIKDVEENQIHAKDVCISIDKDQQPHRSYKTITMLIAESNLDDQVKNISQEIFLNLARAEAKIHHTNVEEVCFHEVGAVDSIIDIVGAVIGIHQLGIKHIYCSPLPLGNGFVECAHGKIPVPAPATMELLKGVPVYQTERIMELVTPTGAAIMRTVAEKFQQMPSMQIIKIGYGSGKTKSDYPPFLRVFLGSLDEESFKIPDFK